MTEEIKNQIRQEVIDALHESLRSDKKLVDAMCKIKEAIYLKEQEGN